MSRSSLCILITLLSATLRVAHLQTPTPRDLIGSCPLPTEQELENLVANSFPAGDNRDVPQTVRILASRILCQASGSSRNTVSTLSVVVFHECSGTFCGTTPVNRTDQFQYDCAEDGGTASLSPPVKIPRGGFRSSDLIITENVDPQRLQATPSNQCGECSEVQISESQVPDSSTHCVACDPACNRGLGRCLGLGDNQCCSFYQNDQCVTDCSAPLVPDEDFDCGCGDLDVPNAMVAFSDGFKIGSVATQTCDEASGFVQSGSTGPVTRSCTTSGWTGSDINCQIATCPQSALVTGPGGNFNTDPSMPPFNFGATATFSCESGYTLEGESTRTCGLNGWSGSNPTCNKLQCTVGDLMVTDGSFTLNSDLPTVGAVATFTCNGNLELSGAETRTCQVIEGTTVGWSNENPSCAGAGGATGGSSGGCGTGCIVGIVLAILGVLILAAILAGVAYAIYSYMNHPDTKLAKYDPDNLNGVAKDNPLYVDPEAVVGAGDGAEAA